MDGRRGRRRWGSHTFLPLRRPRQPSNTVSCWYCDFKFFAFNDPLFRLGVKHSGYLRVWFSIGIGFTLASLLGVTIFIICELAGTPLISLGYAQSDYSNGWLSFLGTGFDISLPNMGFLCLSSIISIIVHEFGHALAAASEGVKMEYLAIFLAALFPGALVAFNHASLQLLPRIASLRIYAAGIWHNAAFCAVCSLALFLLPFILSPLYIHGETTMVVDVPSVSPLSGYLSPHDIIVSLNDFRIHTGEDWKKIMNMLIEQSHSNSFNQPTGAAKIGKSYCVPDSLLEESTHARFEGNLTYCSDELVPFASVTCLDAGDGSNHQVKRESIRCLDANDVIKLRKCPYSSVQTPKHTGGCLCSQGESCMIPLQLPGLGWVEITYSSVECRNEKSLSPDEKNSSSIEGECLKSFVFVGDLISMANSIHLTSYMPRWSIYFAACIPNLLEKFLSCTFHVSLVVALLNSLPVYFLDGECILEVIVHYCGLLSSRMKQLVLRCCLLLGTLISALYVLRPIYAIILAMVTRR